MRAFSGSQRICRMWHCAPALEPRLTLSPGDFRSWDLAVNESVAPRCQQLPPQAWIVAALSQFADPLNPSHVSFFILYVLFIVIFYYIYIYIYIIHMHMYVISCFLSFRCLVLINTNQTTHLFPPVLSRGGLSFRSPLRVAWELWASRVTPGARDTMHARGRERRRSRTARFGAVCTREMAKESRSRHEPQSLSDPTDPERLIIYILISSIRVYTYIWVMSYPPPCFLTTLQYTQIHGKDSLGIIFPTFPKKLKTTRRNMNNSKTNSNNINTGYPALDPTANKYL